MAHVLRIALLAEHSIGKSSFINALVGNIIAPTSLQRETSRIDVYQIRMTAPYNNIQILVSEIEQRHNENTERRKLKQPLNFDDLKKPRKIEPPIKIIGTSINVDIYDFPGLNDADDKDNLYLRIFKENARDIDLIIYMVDAKKPLTNSSEIKQLHEIIQFIEELKKDGIFLDIIIVINKFDDIADNEDYKELFENLVETVKREFKQEIKIFRFCSHKFFIHNLKSNLKKFKIPSSCLKELQVIFKTANVNITRNLKQAIQNSSIIDCDIIEIMEDIMNLSDEKPINKSIKLIGGDWDNLVHFIENLNIFEKHSENSKKYLLAQYMLLPIKSSIMQIYHFISIIEKQLSDISNKKMDYDINDTLEHICCNMINAKKMIYYSGSGCTYELIQIFIPTLLRIHPDKKMYRFIIDLLFKDKYSLYSKELSWNTKMVLLHNLLENHSLRAYNANILRLFDEEDIYNKTSTLYELCSQDKTSLTSLDKCKTITIEHKSVIIHQIVNNPKIKEKNPDLYQIVLLTVSPHIILKTLPSNRFDIIKKYLGNDSIIYLKLYLDSNNISDSDSIENAIFSQNSFSKIRPELFKYNKIYCLHYI